MRFIWFYCFIILIASISLYFVPFELQALTVLDYLVAHGSARVIDEIREHAYQISVIYDTHYATCYDHRLFYL